MNTTLLEFYESACNDSVQDAVAEMRHQINPSAAYDDIVDCQLMVLGKKVAILRSIEFVPQLKRQLKKSATTRS